MATKSKQSTIHISLTPTLEEYVQSLLDTGLYGNVSEIVREALREKYQNSQSKAAKLAKLRELIQVGLDQVERGDFSTKSVEDIWNDVKKEDL